MRYFWSIKNNKFTFEQLLPGGGGGGDRGGGDGCREVTAAMGAEETAKVTV